MKRKVIGSAFVGIVFIQVTVHIDAAPFSFKSGENQAALVELYTSEGCSSCPPAEAWLSRLKDGPGLWKEFVPVAFHVDYWDYLGWRDKWSAEAFSARQRAYASAWHNDNIYTPGFILNGSEWRRWNDRKSIPAPAHTNAGILVVNSEDASHWKISFVPAKTGSQGYEVYGALLGNELHSEVKAGENRGRRLDHDFVVVAFAKAPLSSSEHVLLGEIRLAPKLNSGEGRLGIAVWITAQNSLKPLQAVGGWIAR